MLNKAMRIEFVRFFDMIQKGILRRVVIDGSFVERDEAQRDGGRTRAAHHQDAQRRRSASDTPEISPCRAAF